MKSGITLVKSDLFKKSAIDAFKSLYVPSATILHDVNF